MAKAILEYDLNEPDDRIAHLRAVMSLDLVLAILEFDEYLRGEYKHNDKPEAYEYRMKLREILGEENIDIDKLVG